VSRRKQIAPTVPVPLAGIRVNGLCQDCKR
jgi:hypothetical protein